VRHLLFRLRRATVYSARSGKRVPSFSPVVTTFPPAFYDVEIYYRADTADGIVGCLRVNWAHIFSSLLFSRMESLFKDEVANEENIA
jgi:hypothetical protein